MSKKSSSIVLLTTSVVLAVAVFLFAYLVKPTDETDVLKKARERQSESLVSVQQPLETDRNVLTKEEQMKNAVYELLLNDKEFTNQIASTISADEQFVDNIFERVTPKIDSYLQTRVDGYVAEFTPQIESYVKELYQNEDPTIFIDKLIEPVTVRIYNDLTAQITADIQKAFATDFENAFMGARGSIEDAIFNRVIEHLDLIAPDYVAAVKGEVVDEVNAQIPEYEAYLKGYINEQISLVIEDAVLALYDKYGDEVLVDIINEVLLRLDGVALSVVDEEGPAPVVEKEEVKPIAPPTFVNTRTERNITNEEYIKERTERRSEIIKDILNKLK